MSHRMTLRCTIKTEAEGFVLLVEVLERLSAEHPHSFSYMCILLKHTSRHSPAVPELDAIPYDVRRAMCKRIESALPPPLTTWGYDITWHDWYGPRIIAAQWFALEAAEEEGTAWLWGPVPPKSAKEAEAQQLAMLNHDAVDHCWIQLLRTEPNECFPRTHRHQRSVMKYVATVARSTGSSS